MQVIARDKDDVDARYDRALLYAEVEEPKKAVIALDGILKGRPGEPEVGLACSTVSSSASPAISGRQEKDIPVHMGHLIASSQAALPGRGGTRMASADASNLLHMSIPVQYVGSLLRMQVVKMLARLHHRMGAPEKAAEVLEAQVREFPDATDLTHINILAELFMDADRYEQAADLIRGAEGLPCMQGGIPIDLTVSFFHNASFEVQAKADWQA